MTQRRRGFTLIEILVALALTLFILIILTQAFVAGADTFRTLKAVGDLNSSLRMTTNMLLCCLGNAVGHYISLPATAASPKHRPCVISDFLTRRLSPDRLASIWLTTSKMSK